jgi:coenzyme F420-reducing hydrogenase delta subunit
LRLDYPTGIRIIRTPCTGRLEVEHFLRAFENGADGVLVAGCEEGSCHFMEGNLLAKRRVKYTRDLLSEAGFEKERLRMINIGAADARRFVEILQGFVETVRGLGSNPLKQTVRLMKQEIRL